MSLNKETKYVECIATGEWGAVYASEKGMEPADLAEFAVGWKQISSSTRRRVWAKRISHAEIL